MKGNVSIKTTTKGLPIVNYQAAGIDVGDIQYDIAICTDGISFEVTKFETFTEDLL